MNAEDPTLRASVRSLFFIRELSATLADILKGVGDWGLEKAEGYLAFVKRATQVFLLTALGLMMLLVVGLVARQDWLIATAGLGIGLSAATVLALATPLGALAVIVGRAVEPARAYLRFVGSFLLWALLLTLYFSVVPVSSNPKAIVLVVLVSAISALMWSLWGIGLDPRRIRFSVTSVLVITTVSFFFPESFRAALALRGRLDEWLADCITDIPACFRGDRSSSLDRIRTHLATGSRNMAQMEFAEAASSLRNAEAALRTFAGQYGRSSALDPLERETKRLLKDVHGAALTVVGHDVAEARKAMERGALSESAQRLRATETDAERLAGLYPGSSELSALQSEIGRLLERAYVAGVAIARRGIEVGTAWARQGAHAQAASEFVSAEAITLSLVAHYPGQTDLARIQGEIAQLLREALAAGLATVRRHIEVARLSTERGAYAEANELLHQAQATLQLLAGSYPSSAEIDSLRTETATLIQMAQDACDGERSVAVRRGTPPPACR